MSKNDVLIGAMVVGLLLALSAAVEPRPKATGDVLAKVGKRDLGVDDLRRLLAADGALRRDAVSLDDARRLLQALVDEELLVQRAVALGLIDTDPTLRRALQSAQRAELAPHMEMKGRTSNLIDGRRVEPLVNLPGTGDGSASPLGDGTALELTPPGQPEREQRRLDLEAGEREYLKHLRTEFPVRIVDPVLAAVPLVEEAP